MLVVTMNITQTITTMHRQTEMVLTVALVAGIDPPLQSFGLCELCQHLRERAVAVIGSGCGPLLHTVIALRKLQGQIPERLHCVRLVVTGQAGHLEKQRRHHDENHEAESHHQTHTHRRLAVFTKRYCSLKGAAFSMRKSIMAVAALKSSLTLQGLFLNITNRQTDSHSQLEIGLLLQQFDPGFGNQVCDQAHSNT